MSFIKKLFYLTIFVGFCSTAYADEYTINKIYVRGLERISLKTVLNYLPVKEGQTVDDSQVSDILHSLYKTNFFNDIKLKRKGDDIYIYVVERQVLEGIKFFGNSKINKKQISEILKKTGLVEGQNFDQSLLNLVIKTINKMYYSVGYYNIDIKTKIKQEGKGRVVVIVNIKEGKVAKIKGIKIVGNKAFGQRTLLNRMFLSTPRPWSFFTDSDKYSEEKLEEDLESLRAYYLDHGYINFKINSKQVTITSDRKYIYITLNVSEGRLYKIKDVSLNCNLADKYDEIMELITIKSGDVFSRGAILDMRKNIIDLLSNYGYGMPNIKIDPIIDDKARKVFIKIDIDVGKHIYVRYINFVGNRVTRDIVLRREMRQHEGELFSLERVERSKKALANLGYLKDVEYTIVPVDSNQVDLTYKVKDASTTGGTFKAGYRDSDGFIYGADLVDTNVLGSGKTVSLKFDNSVITQNYGLGYTDPYFTDSNLSLHLAGYFQKSNLAKKIDIIKYAEDIYGVDVIFGAPISNYSRFNFGFGGEHRKIIQRAPYSDIIQKFTNDHGSMFNQIKAIAQWSYSDFDKIPFSTKGFAQTISCNVYGPLDRNSLQFYKVNYLTSWYQPLFRDFVFHTGTEIGYGNGFGNTRELPFFENFFAGGIGTVRGFEDGTLGRVDNLNHAFGGNLLTVATASIIIPNPMKDSLRTSVFVDVGNANYNKFKFGDLRSSYGVCVEWLTPFGAPLTFSLAKPITQKTTDHTKMFQFSIALSR